MADLENGIAVLLLLWSRGYGHGLETPKPVRT